MFHLLEDNLVTMEALITRGLYDANLLLVISEVQFKFKRSYTLIAFTQNKERQMVFVCVWDAGTDANV